MQASHATILLAALQPIRNDFPAPFHGSARGTLATVILLDYIAFFYE